MVSKRIVREIPMMRWVTFLCASIAGFGGCASIEDYHYSWANHRRAALAWEKGSTIHDRVHSSAHYEHGWKEGYFDVCMGKSGEPPVVPPNKYWSPRYQGESGQLAIEDWYAGYQDGATSAQCSGVGEWHPIYTGPSVPTTPLGWPVIEEFPTQVLPEARPAVDLPARPAAELPSVLPKSSNSTSAHLSSMPQGPAPNELDASPTLDTSRRLPPPVEESTPAPTVEEASPALTPIATPALPSPEENDLAPPVFTEE